MADLVMILVVVGFFGLCSAYVALCDRIVGRDEPMVADRSSGDAELHEVLQ